MTSEARTAVYLYGVARGLAPSALDGVTGVAGEPVRALAHRGTALTALVSTVSLTDFGEEALRENLEDLAWLEGTARAHHDVVAHAARNAPTAPVRIATLYRDDQRVRDVLGRDHTHLTDLLDRVTGRTEWGVKAYAIPEAVQQDEPEPESEVEVPALTAGTAYLQRRQAARRVRRALQDRLADHARTLHDELADHAVASRQHAAQDSRLSGRHETLILNMAYLVDDEQADGFHEVARAADRRLPGVTVEITGPWPPYSFIATAEATPTPPPNPRPTPETGPTPEPGSHPEPASNPAPIPTPTPEGGRR
ncbi:GvpL/GvpF family gas vesicle protein [Actinomadura oligospora]|uniref:GvpL/GvpF family gas vesicle protein n=1 Tax=Actinomadura oligospora TaxID=111804 RepID=UPI0004B205B4|nr:GvpL/GvpF family gas vesicle protein [Actinomadura oligospora]